MPKRLQELAVVLVRFAIDRGQLPWRLSLIPK